MPRKKAEPEVLQEETVQPEITDIEELTPAEQPGLAPQIEEPVQPYGEEESSAAEELPEPSEPEKKSFYDLDFRALDQDLSPEERLLNEVTPPAGPSRLTGSGFGRPPSFVQLRIPASVTCGVKITPGLPCVPRDG